MCVGGEGITIVSGPGGGGGSFEPPDPPPLATGLSGMYIHGTLCVSKSLASGDNGVD